MGHQGKNTKTKLYALGGNKGIGRVIIESFLAEGANVSYCSRSASEDDFADFNGAIEGAKVLGTKVDIGNQDDVRAWVEKSAEKYGRIDVVVANGKRSYIRQQESQARLTRAVYSICHFPLVFY
jgi:NAD(P)-dependent dehydrogenase (short-subunit alcohol dehydrogenase family)